jgi:hypothetical protein
MARRRAEGDRGKREDRASRGRAGTGRGRGARRQNRPHVTAIVAGETVDVEALIADRARLQREVDVLQHASDQNAENFGRAAMQRDDARNRLEEAETLGGPVSWDRAANAIAAFGSQSACDLSTARLIATAAIERYGDFGPEMMTLFKQGGIWNDHPAVQAALAAIRLHHREF